MIKKEFSEIKKTLTTANTGFRRMFASYIPLDGDPVKLIHPGFWLKVKMKLSFISNCSKRLFREQSVNSL